MNKYLQVHVMGEELHIVHQDMREHVSGTGIVYRCECEGPSELTFRGRLWHDSHTNPDFSDPTHYEALRKQLDKLNQWGEFEAFMLNHPDSCGDYGLFEWESSDLSVKVKYIYEYAKSKGPEYWQEKRGE